MARTVQGMAHTWQVSDTPTGSGDAGEVFAVACLDQLNLTGMMKKPARIATAGTIQRQAGQIAQEAVALARLDGLPDGKAHPPRLLDQAPEYTMGTGNYFIISETAPGDDLASLLTQTRQTGKPFPRRVIMTVLDALFDMFSRAHKAGVLWNDVKLDHIYWHNATGQVGVIDWGNAIFLDSEGQLALPRWEDYQQMVDTLGNFLQRSAPELYVDLGWDEFQGKTLDSARVSVLARRISYQQQVIALQVMEYQSLIRVALTSDSSLEGLRKIAGYKEILEKIGAPWEREDVLKYSQSLVETALAEGDLQTSVSATALIWDIFNDSLDLPWYLMREFCRHPDILTHRSFPDLAKHTLNNSWEKALWAASTIAHQSQDPTWWDGLIPVMRQKALDTTTPAPYQACQSMLKWAQTDQHTDLAQRLDHILNNWRHKGEGEMESPFEYELLDILRDQENLPSRLRSDIKHSFALGEEAIRELIKVWTNANWEALPKAFCRVLSWDPDRWGILHISEQIEIFKSWLTTLFDGPGVELKARSFLEHLLETRPQIERMLGAPPWLSALLQTINQINMGAPIPAFHEEVSLYCPWLLQFADIDAADSPLPDPDKARLHTLLSHFSAHLKHWSDVDAGLIEIREQAPLVFPRCERLAQGFKTIFSLNVNLDELNAIITEDYPSELIEGAQVLQALVAWREHLANQDLTSAVESIREYKNDTWMLSAHAYQVSTTWQNLILPALEAISTFSIIMDFGETPPNAHINKLGVIAHTCAELPVLWAQIYNSGIYNQLLEALQSAIDGARSAFLEWRSAFENTTDQATRLLYHHHLVRIRQASKRMMRMSQHIRQAKLALATLGEGDQVSLTIKMRTIDNILDHLSALEAELVPNPDERHFPDYQHAFRQISEADNAETRQSFMAALPENHPFYAWLVKSTLTQNTHYS